MAGGAASRFGGKAKGLETVGGERILDRVVRIVTEAVGEPPLMLALSVFSAITHAIASLAPGRVPPLNTPATPQAIMHAVDSLRDGAS